MPGHVGAYFPARSPCAGRHFLKAKRRTLHPSLFSFIMLVLAQHPFLRKSFELEYVM